MLTTAAAVVSSPSPGASSTARRRKPLPLLRYKAPSFLQPTRRLAGRAVAASASGRQDRDRVVCKAKDASSATDHVGDVGEQTWDDAVLGCETAVLVEFWAP
ncbi:thioredoxin M4, chloroplastic-like [Brachypodium distachyon]|uniref:thioredoxin M4, chloroplastic-like n=1 Tax=Brachypodium distachyon TaxID=15368 RepID=UPI000D0D4A30|nr:thioredoxin M4, chloroplastic-like [Brachypodium distachyon]|eukprot:XP_024310562.1 thioredoxin M4, chloroplastic-like [Brachypodium distachyon]